MSTIKVLPYAAHDIDTVHTGGWKAIGLGSSGQFSNALLLQAVTDGSDTTYIVNLRWDVVSQVGYTFHAPVIPALGQIRQVLAYVRANPNFTILGGPSRTELWNLAFQSADGSSYGGVVRPSLTQDASGQPPPADLALPLPGIPTTGEWTPDVFEGMALTIFGPYDPTAGGTFIQIEELALQFVVNEAPTVTVSVDSNPETTTQRPTLTVVYTDPEGDAQERLEYRLYAQPAGGWAGFNPDTTALAPALTEVVFTAAATYRLPTPVPNNTYRLYVRAADAGSGGRFGPWAYCDLVVAVPPSTRPTMTAQGDVTRCQIEGKVTVAGPTQQPFGAIVQRRNDDGTWATVMECGGLVLTGGTAGNGWTWTANWRDRTAPRNKVLVYQAITIGADNDNLSQASPGVYVFLPDDGNTWLILGAADASMDMPCKQAGGANGWPTLSEEDQFAFGPEGRKNYVMVAGTIHGEYQTSNTGLQFTFATQAATDLFEKLRGQRKPVLVKTRYGDAGYRQLWVRFGKVRTLTPLGSGQMNRGQPRGAGQQNLVQVPFYEVDQPAI